MLRPLVPVMHRCLSGGLHRIRLLPVRGGELVSLGLVQGPLGVGEEVLEIIEEKEGVDEEKGER